MLLILLVNCGEGYFHNTETDLCEPCSVGTFNENEKQTSCESCDPGQTTLTTGSTGMQACYSEFKLSHDYADIGFILLCTSEMIL